MANRGGRAAPAGGGGKICQFKLVLLGTSIDTLPAYSIVCIGHLLLSFTPPHFSSMSPVRTFDLSLFVSNLSCNVPSAMRAKHIPIQPTCCSYAMLALRIVYLN